jgi:hypothetical protein
MSFRKEDANEEPMKKKPDLLEKLEFGSNRRRPGICQELLSCKDSARRWPK